MKKLFVPFVFAASFVAGSPAVAGSQEKAVAPASVPDNTEKNAERESAGLKNAMDAGQKEAEVKLAANIRQALVREKSLSTYAHNVKVIVNGNSVHLAGPVRTAAERSEVERIARSQAASAKITNEIQVAPQTK